MSALNVLVPSRGRPESVAKMADAWTETGAAGRATLTWIIDMDDPRYMDYLHELKFWEWMKRGVMTSWLPMVPKLNMAARLAAEASPTVGFMGDDHLPRSKNWDLAITGYAAATEPAIIYGKDGFQDEKLPTWWAMSSTIIKTLGRMVPAEVQHLYCDNAVMRLGEATNTLHYLPHVLVEHMHPLAGKSEMDAGYARVNRREQYDRDQGLYRDWLNTRLDEDARLVRELRGV